MDSSKLHLYGITKVNNLILKPKELLCLKFRFFFRDIKII